MRPSLAAVGGDDDHVLGVGVERVRHEIGDDAFEQGAVGVHGRQLVVDTVGDPRPLVLRHERDDAVDECRQIGLAEVHPQHAGLEPSGVEQVLDDQHEPVDLAVGEHDQLALLRRVERDIGGEQARGRQLGGRQWRSQVVRDGPQECGPQVVGRRQLLGLGGAHLEHVAPPPGGVDERRHRRRHGEEDDQLGEPLGVGHIERVQRLREEEVHEQEGDDRNRDPDDRPAGRGQGDDCGEVEQEDDREADVVAPGDEDQRQQREDHDRDAGTDQLTAAAQTGREQEPGAADGGGDMRHDASQPHLFRFPGDGHQDRC